MGLGVLKVVDKVLSNKRVQGALCATPAPAINGQDQRLDVLIANEVMGQPTGDLGFSEKIRAGRIVPNLSSFSQKFSAGCYGFVLYRSYAIATMRGV